MTCSCLNRRCFVLNTLFLGAALLAVMPGRAQTTNSNPWILENETLQVRVNAQNGRWDVLDKRSGHLWKQAEEVARKQWTVPIAHVAASPKLDGDLGEWNGQAILVDSKTGTIDKPTTSKDCSARFRFSWNREGWWLAAEINDETLVHPNAKTAQWHVDGVEFWLGREHWAFLPTETEVEICCWSNDKMKAGCRAAWKARPNGWNLEAFIPWSAISAMPKAGAGKEMLLAFGVNDSDKAGEPKRQCQLFYPPRYKHKNFATHATAKLEATTQTKAPTAATKRPQSNVRVKQIAPLAQPANGLLLQLDYTQQNGQTIPLTAKIELSPTTGDVNYELYGDSQTRFQEIRLPLPFVLDAPEGKLVIPQGAGLLFGVDELDWNGGHLGGKMSMPWFGMSDFDTGQGYLAIFENFADATFKGTKVTGEKREVLSVQPIFRPEKGNLGYPRKMIYHFLNTGNYVAMAKRYRAYAQKTGLLKTLAEKRKTRPNIDRMVGAINIYCSHFSNILDLRALGVERAMVSGGFSPDQVRQMNEWGYLPGRYDIYTDLYKPDAPPSKWERCQGFHFPEDVIKNPDGSIKVGWCPIPNKKTGKKDLSYIACWTCGLRVLKEKMPKRLAKHDFTSYFLDCVTSTALRECYDPNHPLTRTQDRETRIAQFAYLSDELKLVVGSETGRGWASNKADYFEGIMSTSSFFANPKSIHEMPFKSTVSTPRYEEYATNPERRVPLFQLVFGDCTETTWRWGDNTHRMPALWAQKDLLQIIHAAMPTWVLWDVHQSLFLGNRERFMETYNNCCRWRRAVGYSEMINHERLAKDGSVQRSSFANGCAVTVNFSKKTVTVDNHSLPPRSYRITGPKDKLIGLPVGKAIRVNDDWQPTLQEESGNSDFEFATHPWRGFGIPLTVEKEIVHGGKQAIRLQGTCDSTFSYGKCRNFPLEAGKTYKLSAWLRVKSVSPSHAPKFKCQLNQDGKYLTNRFTNAYDMSKLDTWQKLETTFKVPAKVDDGYIALEKGSKESLEATLFIDDVKLELVPKK